MAVCSFLGERSLDVIFDNDIYQRLQNAVDKIVKENDQVDFWFYENHFSRYYDFCFLTAWEAKMNYPKKDITLSMVVENERRDEYIWNLYNYETSIPYVLIDNIISAPKFEKPKRERDFTSIHKMMIRWQIEQSSHVVSYIYKDFHETSNHYLDYAKRCGKEVVDITCEETVEYIKQQFNTLTERGHQIMKRLNEGQSQKQIAEALGISTSSVREDIKKCGKELRRTAKTRYVKMLSENPLVPVYQTCAIFDLPFDGYEQIALFEQMIKFLINVGGVMTFLVLSDCCKGGYMAMLKSLVKHNKDFHIVCITHFPDLSQVSEKEKIELYEKLNPPCDMILNADTHSERIPVQIGRAVAKMIKNSDFCICGLIDSPYKRNTISQITKVKNVKALDICRKWPFDSEEMKKVRKSVGAEIVLKKIPDVCPYCGEMLVSDSPNFCASCGKQVREIPPEYTGIIAPEEERHTPMQVVEKRERIKSKRGF